MNCSVCDEVITTDVARASWETISHYERKHADLIWVMLWKFKMRGE